MEVILLEKIEKLGQMGDLVTVKPGFARNFLLPQKKAVTATDENKAHFNRQRTQLEAQNLKQKSEAEKIGKKLNGKTIIIVRQAGEAGQLYGSVSARDISNGITESGFSIDRSQVKLENPIKTVGMHSIQITLHPEVSVSATINVARSNEEAKIQDKTGKAVAKDEEQPNAVEELVEQLDAEELNMPSSTEAEDQAAKVLATVEEVSTAIDPENVTESKNETTDEKTE